MNLRQFAVNLPWQYFDILISFKVAASINFEVVTSSNFLTGHSAKIKYMQRFISLSRSKSRFCQPSEIVFLSSIALLKGKIWKKTFGPISVLIPYYFCALLLAKKGCKFSLLAAG